MLNGWVLVFLMIVIFELLNLFVYNIKINIGEVLYKYVFELIRIKYIFLVLVMLFLYNEYLINIYICLLN